MKKVFTFRVVYFKPSGKFYTEAEIDLEVQVTGPEGSPTVPYMQDAVDHITGIRDGRIPGPMPGLSTIWRGHVVIDCQEGFPCLIPSMLAVE